MKQTEISARKIRTPAMKAIQCEGVISSGVILIYNLRFARRLQPESNAIANLQSQTGQTFADAAFCMVTPDPPMCGRSPLLRHKTQALAM